MQWILLIALFLLFFAIGKFVYRAFYPKPYIGVGLYFEDVTHIFLPPDSPQAKELMQLGAEAIALVRNPKIDT